jgi:replicative DNA helicase
LIADLDAERAVLGCLLQGMDATLARTLAPSDFHAPAHRRVFEAALSLVSIGQPVDTLTVADRLKAASALEEVGGPAYLMRLDQQVPDSGNLPSYVGIVRDRARRRAIVEAARKAAASAANLEQDSSVAALEASAALATLGSAGAGEIGSLQDALMDELDNLHAIASGKKAAAMLTGVDVWDAQLGGLMPGRLTCIGAYPSVGKSAIKAAFVKGLAGNAIKSGLFELEDPRAAVARRYVAQGSGIPVRRLASERLPDFLLESAGAAIEEAHRWAAHVKIEDRSGLTASQVAAEARQMVVQHGCRAIFVDHAGEMKLDANLGRYDLDVSAAVRQLRDVAKDLDVAVVLFAHFHRPKTQSDKEPRYLRPNSAAWKNSGGFEEAARVAVGLWLPDPNDRDLAGGLMATVLKQTEGEKDIDFWMPMVKHAGVVGAIGGRAVEGQQGYTNAGDGR